MATTKDKSLDVKMMRRCFELAKKGHGKVAPNPLVGCVITYQNKIIGEGYHHEFGKAHAEVNAINSVKNKELLKDSTLYVNLEPCSHYGKTPPCADLIISHNISRVVICNNDPFIKVAGRGIKKLRDAGIEVETGILENEGIQVNCRFFTFHNEKRPWVILKWAETADGFLDIQRVPGDEMRPKWITNQTAKHIVHKWRSQEQSILIGRNTAILDNPMLNVREWSGDHPTRLVIDPELDTDTGLNIYNKKHPTIIYNYQKDEENENLIYKKIIPDKPITDILLEDIYSRDIQSVIVEGGAEVLKTFIRNGCWDETRRFIADVFFGSGVAAPQFNHIPQEIEYFGSTRLYKYYNQQIKIFN